MLILSKQDIFQVHFASLIADYDYDTILNLYMPIIGYKACIIYFKLISLAKRNNYKVFVFDDLISDMQMSVGDFASEKEKLEGIGLISTFIKKENNINNYLFNLYAPKVPSKFFNDVLLNGLLIESLGERKSQELKNIYLLNNDLDDKYQNISAKFGEIFKPDYNAKYMQNIINDNSNILGHGSNKFNLDFDYDIFLKFISENSQISKTIFNKKNLKEIQRLSSLYGINEETSAKYVIQCFDPLKENGHKIDFEKLNYLYQHNIKLPSFENEDNTNTNSSVSLNSSQTPLGQKINLMETQAPKDFLQLLQNNIAPVQADLDLIETLSKNLNLKPCVINAILDYTLQVNNNILSRRYVEKIASSLAREKITTAYDAITYLTKRNKRKTKTSTINSEKQLENLDDNNDENLNKDINKNDAFEQLIAQFGDDD